MISWAALSQRNGLEAREERRKAGGSEPSPRRWGGLLDRVKKRARRRNRKIAAQYAAEKELTT